MDRTQAESCILDLARKNPAFRRKALANPAKALRYFMALTPREALECKAVSALSGRDILGITPRRTHSSD